MDATPKQLDTSPPYLWRIEKARQRLLGTKPYADIENARIMTESFIKIEGEPYVVRKAKAFREQCERKTFHIWEDELIGYKTKIVRNCAFHQHIQKKINACYMGPIV